MRMHTYGRVDVDYSKRFDEMQCAAGYEPGEEWVTGDEFTGAPRPVGLTEADVVFVGFDRPMRGDAVVAALTAAGMRAAGPWEVLAVLAEFFPTDDDFAVLRAAGKMWTFPVCALGMVSDDNKVLILDYGLLFSGHAERLMGLDPFDRMWDTSWWFVAMHTAEA